jgi:hypothetical protein
MRNAWYILGVNPKQKEQLEISRRRRGDNIKMSSLSSI